MPTIVAAAASKFTLLIAEPVESKAAGLLGGDPVNSIDVVPDLTTRSVMDTMVSGNSLGHDAASSVSTTATANRAKEK